MKQSALKKIRVLIALSIGLLTLFLFIDFSGAFAPVFYDRFTSIQFVPSLVKVIKTGAISGGAFIILIILTLLFGRVYCSAICPLGILQDGIAYLKKKIKKKKFRYRYTRPYHFLRYFLLAATAISIISGSMLVLNLLDPYSNFGRISSDLLRPVYISLNNILAGIFEKFNMYSLYKIDLYIRWKTLLPPTFILGLLLLLVLKHGRLFCNIICPVGTLLGLLSKISLFKIQFDNTHCTSCNKCSLVCKAECIEVKNKKVDFSRCVTCYNCINICPETAIQYRQIIFPKKKAGPATESNNGRREFITKTTFSLLTLLGISNVFKGAALRANNINNLIPNKKHHPVSPPGSLSIDRFNDACTACHLCVSACPSNVIQPSFMEYGLKGFLQPHLDYHASYCNYECTVCSKVCPTGALLPVNKEEKMAIQLGVVHFIKTNCVVYTEETSCGACAEHCPTQAVFMVPYKPGLTIPDTNQSICVGCGACEHICPVWPYRAIFVDGNAVHKKAERPIIEDMDYEELEEFPF